MLKQSGCLFISMDDNKMAEVKIIANEIFGTRNFLGTFITKQATRSNAKHINITHEYVLSYAKIKRSLLVLKSYERFCPFMLEH